MAIALITGVVVLVAAGLWGPIASQVEQAKYTVVRSEKNIEMRDYAPMLVAEVSVSGDRETAINQGFRFLADYIFGNNTAQNKIAMTAPVMQTNNEKIAMTAPVMQQADAGKWTVRFTMPAQYTMETLPKPNNEQVKIVAVPSVQVAVIKFSGFATPSNIAKNENDLKNFLAQKNLQTNRLPTYAFYNPPWTLPFLRRNEVMLELTK